MKEKILNEMISYINNDIGYPVQLDADTRLKEDAGLDSIDILDLIGYLERTYDIKVEDDQLKEMRGSLGSIASFIESIL